MTATTVDQEGATGISIAARLDRLSLSRLHVAVIALCTLGLAVDIGEVALSNTFSAIFLSPPYSASRSEVAWLLAAVFAGGAVGAPFFGWWADRNGRRAALQVALATLVVSSLAVAFSPNIAWMTAFRFVSGLTLGAYPPLTAAYLADVLPPRSRGRNMMLCGALAFLGAPAVIFLIRWLTPWTPLAIEGWRWALLVAAAVSAATAGLFFCVPESPRWLAALGRTGAAERAYRFFETSAQHPAESLGGGPANATSTLTRPTQDDSVRAAATPHHYRRAFLLAALYGLGPWATIGFPLLSAAVMLQKGFRVGDSLLFAGISMLGPAARRNRPISWCAPAARIYVPSGAHSARMQAPRGMRHRSSRHTPSRYAAGVLVVMPRRPLAFLCPALHRGTSLHALLDGDVTVAIDVMRQHADRNERHGG